MGFLTQFLAGSVSAGALTYIFHSTILSTTNTLSNDLAELSARLNSLSVAPTYTTPEHEGLPTRLPLKEAIKSRWNETLFEAVRTTQNVNWGNVANKGWQSIKDLKARLE